MAFNISRFQAITGARGFLPTNKYDVNIFFESPKMGASFISNFTSGTIPSSEIARDLSYRCINASLPGLTMRTSDVNRFGLGVQEKMPFSANYTDVSLTFTCDKYGAAYNFWYAWFNYIFAINGQVTNSVVASATRPYYTTEYKDNYAATIVINVYDNTGVLSLQYVLFKAFPLSINDINVSWSDNNSLMKITTNITFREWSLSGGNAILQVPISGPGISTLSAIPATR